MNSKSKVILVCAAVGLMGGALSTVITSMTLGLGIAFLGAVCGAVFAAVCWQRATSPGAGLVWGLGYALLLWLLLPAGLLPLLNTQQHAMGMLDVAREHFPELVSYIVCIGAPLGIALGTLAPQLDGLATENQKSKIVNSVGRAPSSSAASQVLWAAGLLANGWSK
jgi:hypothetical protein